MDRDLLKISDIGRDEDSTDIECKYLFLVTINQPFNYKIANGLFVYLSHTANLNKQLFSELLFAG